MKDSADLLDNDVVVRIVLMLDLQQANRRRDLSERPREFSHCSTSLLSRSVVRFSSSANDFSLSSLCKSKARNKRQIVSTRALRKSKRHDLFLNERDLQGLS